MDLTDKLQIGEDYIKNGVLKWLPSDTEEALFERLKKDPKNASLLYYLENPITYKLNNYGFRTPVNFTDGIEGNVFLGCSHTIGIGHYLESTWSWKLNEYIGGNFLNLSVAGTGIGTGFRLLHGLKEMIRPKNVFLYYPHVHRFEYYHARYKKWQTVSAPHNPSMKFMYESNNIEMYYYLHYNAIKNLCKEFDVPLYTINELFSLFNQTSTLPRIARDNHLSPSTHINIFERFKEVYDNKTEIYSRPANLLPLTKSIL